MAAKQASPVAKAAAVLFSSLVAPLIVNVTATVIKDDMQKPTAEPVRQVVRDEPAPTVTLLPPATVTPDVAAK